MIAHVVKHPVGLWFSQTTYSYETVKGTNWACNSDELGNFFGNVWPENA